MEFSGVREVTVKGTNCLVDITRGTDEVCSVVSAKEKCFAVKHEDGALYVAQKSGNILRRGLSRRLELKIVLPKSFYGKLRFRNKNGGLYLSGGCYKDLDISTKNGNFDVCDVVCTQFTLKMRNGNISVKSVRASDGASVKCANGHVRVETLSAPELNVCCRNSALTVIDVKTEKLECATRNGHIDVSAVASPDIKLETSNGKINALVLGKRNDYRTTLETSNGAINLEGVPSKNVNDPAGAKYRMTAKTSNGEIDVKFS